MFWTRICICNLHRFIQRRVARSIPRAGLNRFTQFCLHWNFESILFLRSAFTSICGFVKNHWVLKLGIHLGNVGCWDTLFGSLYTLPWCSSWSWSKLISIWVRLRNPNKTPILTVFSELRLIYKSDWALNLCGPWKHIACVKFHLSRSPFGSISHSKLDFELLKSSLGSDTVLSRSGLLCARFVIRLFCWSSCES
jgi:hypothetical protein